MSFSDSDHGKGKENGCEEQRCIPNETPVYLED